MSLLTRPPQARSEALREAPKPPGNTLLLQCCAHCHQVQHPPRELCANCLRDQLHWQAVSDNTGTPIASVELWHSLHSFFQERLPWRIATIKLRCGPIVIAHLISEGDPTPNEIAVYSIAGRGESPLLIGVRAGADAAARAQRAAARLGLLEDTRND